MPANSPPLLPPSPRGEGLRLFRKSRAAQRPITSASMALFRFGEQCNNHCPMCSNTGAPGLFFHPTEELLRRADFLRQSGFRRAMVTGGEATIHPGFWSVIDRLVAHGMEWDVNTHGRSFAKPDFARRASASGLGRAIVSLHSHQPAVSAAIFGAGEDAHQETLAGIDQLLATGVDVMLNCVLSRLNLDAIDEQLDAQWRRFGRGVAFKFVFPSTLGKGGSWSPIAGLRYRDVEPAVRRIQATAESRGLRVFFESIPNCVLGRSGSAHLGRSAFGESHYLDDADGRQIYSMRHIEAELSSFAESCRSCAALRQCPGIATTYARAHGVDELTPFASLDGGPDGARDVPANRSEGVDAAPREEVRP